MQPHSITLRVSHSKLTGWRRKEGNYISTLNMVFYFIMIWSDGIVFRTLVKKSLQPAANASCRSLCKELAVNATMMTGLLKSAVFIRLSPSSRHLVYFITIRKRRRRGGAVLRRRRCC